MKYKTFELAIEALRTIARNEERARLGGVEIEKLTQPMIDALMQIVEDDYRGQDIGYFCWELEFGELWEPDKVTDHYGRDVKMSTVRELYNYLEHEKWFKTEWQYPGEGRAIGHGRHKGMDYFLYWNDSWWCAYIDVTGTKWHGVDYREIDELDCHGGLTFSCSYLCWDEDHGNDEDRWYLGWDYDHFGDEWITIKAAPHIEKQIIEFIKQLEVDD